VLPDVYWELHSGCSEEHLKFMLQRLFYILWLTVVYASLWEKKREGHVKGERGDDMIYPCRAVQLGQQETQAGTVGKAGRRARRQSHFLGKS